MIISWSIMQLFIHYTQFFSVPVTFARQKAANIEMNVI